MQRRPRRLSTRLLLASGLLLAAGCSDRLPLEPMADAPRAPSTSPTLNLNTSPAGFIRIGVVQSATTVQIGGTGDFMVTNKASGAVLLTGSNEDLDVSLASNAIVHDYLFLQVACVQEEAASAHAARLVEAGYQSMVVKHATVNCWRVLAGQFPLSTPASVTDAFRSELVAQDLAPTNAFRSRHSWTEGTWEFRISRAGTLVAVSNDQIVLTPTSGMVRIAEQPYRGVAEVLVNSGGTLAAVNELPIEEYLYGVVPNELPPRVWPQLEAQKAQAVAARTFAIRRLGNRAADGYDVLPTQTDQVYRGLSSEHPISTQAVNETAGVVATHNGRLIESVYSSTAGGFTADNEESFASSPIPYLRGIPDSERGAAFQNVPTVEVFKNAKNATLLRTYQPANYEDEDWSRYYRWRGDWTAEEMSRVISLYAGKDVGKVLEINALERGRSGRIIEIEYVTEQGTFRATKFGIRTSLQFVNENGTLSALFSTLFFIEPVVDPKTKAITGWTAYGGGWGHGVGMSQTGAASRADKGQTYEQILKHYYQGIDLETRTY